MILKRTSLNWWSIMFMTKNGKCTKKNKYASSKQWKRFFNLHQHTNSCHLYLTLNKPIYVGFTVLELSKWFMYDFHYNFFKKHFDVELLFTDTGSLTYQIKSIDVYEEFFKHKHLFDLVTIQKIQSFLIRLIKKLLVKWKTKKKEK